VLFLGSNVRNYRSAGRPPAAGRALAHLQPGDALLMAPICAKAGARLVPAYDDAAASPPSSP